MISRIPSILLSLMFLFAAPLRAGEPYKIPYETPPPVELSWFDRGRWSVEALFEGYRSFTLGDSQPRIDYVQGSLRV